VDTTPAPDGRDHPGVLPPLLRSLTDAIPTGVALVDGTGRIALANLAFLRTFDAPFGTTLVGMTVAEVSRQEPFNHATELWDNRPHEGRPAEPGHRYRCTLPHGREIEGSWHRLDADDGTYAVTVAGVTGEAHVRQRLREHNRALAELVAARTELVSALLHEVRTPLTSARSMAEMVAGSMSDTFVDDVLRVILRKLDRISAVTDEIAMINSIENGTIDLVTEPVDLTDLLRQAVVRLGSTRPVVVSDSDGATVYGDPARLAEAFEGLLSAALAISDPDQPMRVEASAGDAEWLVTLLLPGQGAADRLFTAAGASGNSTALMLARAVLGRHGGSLQIQTRDGVPGLSVRLPIGKPADADADVALGLLPS
jgi:signal transduction histidine kinase